MLADTDCAILVLNVNGFLNSGMHLATNEEPYAPPDF